MADKVLEVNNLSTTFKLRKDKLSAIEDINFTLHEGEILAIVGESGCGKSVTANSIMRLLPEKGKTLYEGEVIFDNNNLLKHSSRKMRKIRGNKISMIFQDPLSSLNPLYTIGNQIIEALIVHQKLNKKQARQKGIELLKSTGIPTPEKRIDEFPHQLSGGMRQRVMIAMALACEPEILIADEPTTALDVTIQYQILKLLKEQQEKRNMSLILITHDLAVVAQFCENIAVMYLGQIVEYGSVKEVFNNPKHPYTKGLLGSIPDINSDRNQALTVIEGNVPSLKNVPKGCRFSTRCPFVEGKCKEEQALLDYKNYKVRCWKHKELGDINVR